MQDSKCEYGHLTTGLHLLTGVTFPPDGGRSLFGPLDFYKMLNQHELDAQVRRGRVGRLLSTTGLAGNRHGRNIGRVLALHDMVFARLGQLGQSEKDTVVYLISPDLLYCEGDVTLPAKYGSASNTLWTMCNVLHPNESSPRGIENGWIAGGLRTLQQFHEGRMQNVPRLIASYYENWLYQTLVRFSTKNIVDGLKKGNSIHMRARCLRGRSRVLPWDGEVTRETRSDLWNEIPYASVSRGLSRMLRDGWSRGAGAVNMSLRWLPIELKRARLICGISFGMPRGLDRRLVLHWCGPGILCLRDPKSKLYLARRRRVGTITSHDKFTEASKFYYKRVFIPGQKAVHFHLVSGHDMMGAVPGFGLTMRNIKGKRLVLLRLED